MTKHRLSLLPFAAMIALIGPAAGAETITGASYAVPVDRYGHFALGRPHEYARLEASTDAGRRAPRSPSKKSEYRFRPGRF